MFNNLYRLIRTTSKTLLPLVALSFVNFYKKDIFNQTQQNFIQQQQNLNKTQKQQHKNQSWNWDRIIQIHSPQQLSASDIRNKTIICYQMTGKVQIDSQVALIAHLFCDKYFGKISSSYQFVFLTPNLNQQQLNQDENLFIVFGSGQSKYIPLNKYLKKSPNSKHFIPNYKNLFKKMLKQVNEFQQLNLNNLHQHLDLLNCTGRDTYQLLIVPSNSSASAIKQSKSILQDYLKNRQIWNSQIVQGIVTDTQTKTILGLNRDGVEPNKVYLIAPLNQNMIEKRKQNIYRIGNKRYSIINGQEIQNNFIFTPIPSNLSHQDYILKVNIDLNQTKPDLVEGVYDYMRDEKIRHIPKLMNFSKSTQPIEITIQKNNYDNIVNAYDSNCMYDNESKKELLYHSHVWKYPHRQLNLEKLREFVDIVTGSQDSEGNSKKQELQFYKSQSETESVRKYSKLIVGEERKRVCERAQVDKVIFHYSKNCHSCKRFGGMYEQVAKQQKQVSFYRIDNDTNKTQGLKNYNSTPIFVMYKKQYPNLEWYFKMPYFTKVLFKNFVQITKQVNVMDNVKLANHIEEHLKNEGLVKQTLKEIL